MLWKELFPDRVKEDHVMDTANSAGNQELGWPDLEEKTAAPVFFHHLHWRHCPHLTQMML